MQGLTLPYLINKLKLPDFDRVKSEEEIDNFIRKQIAMQGLLRLQEQHSGVLSRHPFLQSLVHKWEEKSSAEAEVLVSKEAKLVYCDVLEHQRNWLLNLNIKKETLNEEVIRKYLVYLDMEEERLQFL